jgi:hypothetical protein
MNAILSRVKTWAGPVVVGCAIAWSLSAAWFSANRVIPVYSELALYWLCLFGGLAGWCFHFINRHACPGLPRLLASPWAGGAALLIIVSAWLMSDWAFFHWKQRAVSQKEWSQMVSDLKRIAIPYHDGAESVHRTPPESVRLLGLGFDFGVMNAWVVDAPGYPGLKAEVLFGYKSRNWGLWVGPEQSLLGFCPACMHAQVASNAFFFTGPRG